MRRVAQPAAPAADGDARSAIREDLGRTILVEAAAGTGKTTSLVERMVALIREGKTTVDRLSAVTFTIKAAAQLGQRFQIGLEKALAAETDPGRKGRLDAALARLDACVIGTIHSFCARLLRERPVEAGIEPGFTSLEEAENLVLQREAWDRFLERLFVEGSSVLARLSRLGVRIEDLRETYDVLCENSDVLAVASAELAEPEFRAEREAIGPFLRKAARALSGEMPEGGWDELSSRLREALRLEAVLDLDRPADFVRLLDPLDRAKGRRDSPAQALWPEIEDLQQTWIGPALRRWREFLHPIVLGAITPAVADFAAWRRREGQLNFQDLLLCARDLLRDHPEVRRALRGRFTPILVDEFQDTDPIQAEVLLYLTGTDTAERDWRRLLPAPGSLFVVGDPKQSIYRFRRADIETYNRVRDLVDRSGGRVLRLTTNFRSTSGLCDWVNGVFAATFPAQPSESQAAHAPLVANKAAGDARSGAFRLEIPAAGRDRGAFEEDAHRIARLIEAALRGLTPGDFLILLRARKNMPLYASALEARGIPWEISGGGAFRDSDDLAALLPLLEALADPDNPVPLVAALRGSLFGVDDPALDRFHEAGGRFTVMAEPPPEGDSRILRAFELLRECRRLSDELPPAAAISRICARLGLLPAAASEPLGRRRAGNLLKALAAARRFSSGGEDFGGVVRRLIRMTEEGEAEEMSTEPGRRDAVRILTLHAAKGLEARVVFLADPSGNPKDHVRFWIDRNRDQAEGHFLVTRKTRDFSEGEIARPLGWEEKAEREREFQLAEHARLLYVGATRAEETLVVSIRRAKSRGSRGGPWERLDPWLTQNALEPGPRPEAPVPPLPQGLEVELAGFRERRAARLAAATVPSVAIESVTRLVHSGAGESPFTQRTGRGMSWGRVIHRLLEGAMRDPELDVKAYAANLLAEEERPEGDLERVVALTEAVRGSGLWRRALAAKRRLVEVPFALNVPSADLGLSGGPATTLLQGAIDLAFEEDSGWTVVDYKSDTLPEDPTELVRFYSKQVGIYRRYWQELTKQPTRAALLFVGSGREVWLEENS